MGEKREENAMRYPIPHSPNPISPIFVEAAGPPISPLYKTKYAVSGWKNWGDRNYPWVSDYSGA